MKNPAPKHDVIELTAAKLAGEWYNIGRAQGLHSKYVSDVEFAKANFEKFIPKAVEILIEMLSSPTTTEHVKLEIYEALMERVHDPELAAIDNRLPAIDVKKLLDITPLKPLVIDSKQPLKDRLKNNIL